jgi:hypothetical protein
VDVADILVEAGLQSWWRFGFCKHVALGAVCESVDRVAIQIQVIHVRIVTPYRTLQIVCKDAIVLLS